MRIMEEPEVYLRTWRDAVHLSSSQFLERMDERVQRLALGTKKLKKAAQLRNLVRIRDKAALEVYLSDFLPTAGTKALEKAAPILFHMFVYLSRYPFLPPPKLGDNKPVMTCDGLLRALVLVSSERAAQFFGGGNFTRARTPADHRRLLFQGLATPRETTCPSLAPSNEQKWRAKAEHRAHEFGSPERQELLGDWAKTNRDEDGDEIFHDLVDIMFEMQPDGPDMPPHVRRDDFTQLAKTLVAEGGLCPVPLHSFSLARFDFSALVELLLVLHLGLENEDALPHNFEASRDLVVQGFFGENRQDVDFDIFDDAFTSGGTNFPELLKQLNELADLFLYVDPE
ncbi:hypothetical protein K438DRAFT_1826253 [Mycena galopus ATCC 62051]|nr:hypothetical protein K438DRAFT_1826253 [Mycena galopus ATCC 62051]